MKSSKPNSNDEEIYFSAFLSFSPFTRFCTLANNSHIILHAWQVG